MYARLHTGNCVVPFDFYLRKAHILRRCDSSIEHKNDEATGKWHYALYTHIQGIIE